MMQWSAQRTLLGYLASALREWLREVQQEQYGNWSNMLHGPAHHHQVALAMRIIPVERQHFDDWLRMRETVYNGIDRAFHQREMQRIIDEDDMECLLATDETGRVCAMVELSLRNIVDGCLSTPVGYIEGIFVDPDCRGAGIARSLTQHAEDWCRARGCREIATDAELDNEEAQRFHERMGFQETYRVVEYRKQLGAVTHE